MIKIKNKYTGFTLAEVLLTLLIIGIVASIVIPALINDTQNAELNTAWKKAYSVATQAYNLAVVDNGGGFGAYSCSDWPNTADPNLKFSAIKSQLKIIKECNGNTYGNCWAPEGVTPYGTSGCSGYSKFYQNHAKTYVTADGMGWMQYTWDTAGASCSTIAIDVNGLKPPNQWGKDVFSFGIGDRKLTPGACDPTNKSTSALSQ